MPQSRNLETHINDQTVKDLIITHLHNIGVFRDYDEVTGLDVSEVGSDGLRKLTLRFERATEVIFHP
jgi:hypothetical protein